MDEEPGEIFETNPRSLQFITITDEPESQKGEFANTVRSHARRSFVYRKRDPRLKQTRTQTPRPVQGPGSEDFTDDPRKRQGKFKLNTWSMTPRKKAVRGDGKKIGVPVPIVRWYGVWSLRVHTKLLSRFRTTSLYSHTKGQSAQRASKM